MSNDDIFDRLVEHGQRPIPSRPALVGLTPERVRERLRVTSARELRHLLGLAEDTHRARVTDQSSEDERRSLAGRQHEFIEQVEELLVESDGEEDLLRVKDYVFELRLDAQSRLESARDELRLDSSRTGMTSTENVDRLRNLHSELADLNETARLVNERLEVAQLCRLFMPEEESTREQAPHRTTRSTGNGSIATLTGDDERLRPQNGGSVWDIADVGSRRMHSGYIGGELTSLQSGRSRTSRRRYRRHFAVALAVLMVMFVVPVVAIVLVSIWIGFDSVLLGLASGVPVVWILWSIRRLVRRHASVMLRHQLDLERQQGANRNERPEPGC